MRELTNPNTITDAVFAAVAAGAAGYLLKGADGADILAAIRAADWS